MCIIKKAVYENGIVLLSVLVENESYLQDMEILFNPKLTPGKWSVDCMCPASSKPQ